jgi:hypothetical protein
MPMKTESLSKRHSSLSGALEELFTVRDLRVDVFG